MRLIIVKILLIHCLMISGCATCGSARYVIDVSKRYEAKKGGLSVSLEPIIDKRKSEEYLGLIPAKYDVLPLFMKITNGSDFIKKIDIDKSYLVNNQRQVQYDSLTIEETIKILQSSGWIPAVLFGLTGSIIAGCTERSKDNNFYHKAYKPRILNSAENGEGVVFFKVPKEVVLDNEFVLCLNVEDINSNNKEEVQIAFTTK